MKQKNGDLQHKISIWITKDDALELIHKNYSVLIKYIDENEDAKLFYTTMTLGCYAPVALIEYDRIAYVYNMYNTRITFDMNVRTSESNFNLSRRETLSLFYNDKIIDKLFIPRMSSIETYGRYLDSNTYKFFVNKNNERKNSTY